QSVSRQCQLTPGRSLDRQPMQRPDDAIEALAQRLIHGTDLTERRSHFEACQRLAGGPHRAVKARRLVAPAAVGRLSDVQRDGGLSAPELAPQVRILTVNALRKGTNDGDGFENE